MADAQELPLEIPVIDLSNESESAKSLVDAAARYGFIFVKNDQVELLQEQINDMFNLVIRHLKFS